jgi:hypothetical protein
MPTNCVVGGCSRNGRDKTASFFSFPNIKNDKARRNAWCQFVKATRKDSFDLPGKHGRHSVTLWELHNTTKPGVLKPPNTQ